VSRDSLLARLDEGLAHKLTLISAPAGFGKTTLVSQWLSDSRFSISDFGLDSTQTSKIQNLKSKIQNRGVGWVSLDAGDNDPVRFWRYILTACQAFDPDLGRSALTLLLTSPQPPFEALLTIFINELAQLPGRYVLVLEDYHLITSSQIHELVTFWLDHFPPTLHLIIITRSDPPLPLARLRARGNLYELRAADLRFSLSETQTFLGQALPFPLSPETVEHLNERTEGWPAGLRLVTLTLQGQWDPEKLEQFLDALAGSHRLILEYLIADVFSAQTEPLQEFLLETSILPRLTGSLCDTITGRTDSAGLLEQLERANLFLLPLDAAGQWYRFHALFAEAMQHYARQRLGEARLRELAGKAGHWYEAQGMLSEAVEAALAAQTCDRAATLIEHLIAPRLAQNEYHTLRRWLEQLPEDVLQVHPTLCMTYAQSLLFTSNRQAPAPLEQLQKPLQMAETYWQSAKNEPKLGEVLALRAIVLWWHGDFLKSFVVARQALNLLPESEVQWRGVSLIFLGAEQLYAGQLSAARQTAVQALTLNQAARNIYGVIDTTILLAEVCTRQGELRQAVQLYRQVLTQTEQTPMNRELAQISNGRALSGLSTLDLEWNDLEAAEQNLSQALVINDQFPENDLLQRSPLLILARLHQARGETAQAQQQLHALLAQTKNPWLLREAEANLARLALATGDLAAVQRWVTTRTEPDEIPRLQQEQEALLLARLLVAQGEADAALLVLEQWQAEAQDEGRSHSTLEITILAALAHFARQDLPQAKQALIEALTLAQAEGYQRIFLEEGEPMAALLQTVLPEVKTTPLAAYIRTLLLAFTDLRLPIDDLRLDSTQTSKIQNLIEPLSPQEERVLRLLAAGLSNPEIARELVVSRNTVKTQVQSIFRKLDVHSREEAADVARELNLL
jgi:LuxR family maltose regulon positive regulatory protein